ncbi:TonB-dependent hemoglobin/transferrin/lactoferrin family receptor [Xanthobacter tagetidis]|uniref:TonB-dependent hemoglobin/transferrin/lactoferrin family receptor n=1 Tax=Xanthobacter tagetidis TaxID=60216 RepID=A0A3L7AAV2_9HYPH|nr:TonB-dependent hemoglobin/transferrin/lactoferrin family receptor [Xanthobacter tagetidis]MBB6306032.1 hemoglobin/transferrin/lactoferrin receptor protein [Xanthobacter tagetidis]RLP77596.1 TonB-dependent hemoglobin/transferrin/lactoferrin family receptor [Xanthobacter tagetidis]
MADGPRRSAFSCHLRELLLTGAASVALLAGAPEAFAQSAAPAAAVDEIALDTLTVVATRSGAERAVDSLAAVSVVGPGELGQLMPSTTQDVFWGMPGTTVLQNGNSSQASINIRGLQDFGRVAVLIDGARQNFTQLGHNDGAGSFFLEPGLLAGVDVVRGPVSNIYGSGAIGGVVSFRTKDAEDLIKPGQTWGVEANGEFAQNGPMGFGSLFAATKVGQNVDLFIGGTVRNRSDYVDGDGNTVPDTAQESWSGIAKATFRPADFHEVKLTALNYESSFTTGNDFPTAASTLYDTDVANRTVTASYNYTNPNDNIWNWRSSAYWNQVEQNQVKSNGSCSNVTGCVGDPRSFKIDTLGFDVNNTSRFLLASTKHAVTLGGDFFHDDVNNEDNFGFGAGYNPSGERSVGGAFAQWQADWTPWLQTIAALRWDSYELSSATVDGTSGDRVSPKITVGITPFTGFTFYGTYAEGYRAPAVTEALVSGMHPPVSIWFNFGFLPNPDLRAEIGKNKELGVNLKYDDIFMKGDKFRAKANIYRNDVDDYINTVFLTAGDSPACAATGWAFCYQYQNIAAARLEGFELESMYDTGTWFAGLNVTVSQGDDVDNDQPLVTIMPNNVAATLGTRMFDNKLTLAVRWQWVAAKTASELPDTLTPAEIDALVTPSFNLVNVYMGYQVNQWATASFSVENLLNEQYTQYQQFLPSAGLTFKAGMRVTLGGGEIAAATPAKYVK